MTLISPTNVETPVEPSHPTHITTCGKTARFVVRHPSEIEREKREAAYYLKVVWPEICGGEEGTTIMNIIPLGWKCPECQVVHAPEG